MTPSTPSSCPRCDGSDVLHIQYGLPENDALDLAKAGKIKLGGCDMSDTYADWHCRGCGFEWYDISDPWKLGVVKRGYAMHVKEQAEAPARKAKREADDAEKRKYWRTKLSDFGDGPQDGTPN